MLRVHIFYLNYKNTAHLYGNNQPLHCNGQDD